MSPEIIGTIVRGFEQLMGGGRTEAQEPKDGEHVDASVVEEPARRGSKMGGYRVRKASPNSTNIYIYEIDE